MFFRLCMGALGEYSLSHRYGTHETCEGLNQEERQEDEMEGEEYHSV